MKKFAFLFALTLLTACETDTSTHIDMQKEFAKHPTAVLTLLDGTEIDGFEGDFCTSVMCFEGPPMDFAAFTYTPYINDTDLIFTVNSTEPINTISLSMLDETGEKVHRELPYTLQDNGSYLIEEPFPTDYSKFTLNVSVDFIVEGRANYLFPLQLQ
jgi:hypothetical protein